MPVLRSAAALVLLLAFALAACDIDGRRTAAVLPAPSLSAGSNPFDNGAPFAGPAVVRTSLVPSTIGFTSVPSFSCPSIAPFASSFSLLISTGSDLWVDHAAFRFVDGSGLPAPLNLTRSDLVDMFGTTLVRSGITRTFNFQPRFGCGFRSRPDSVFIDVSLLDGFGTTHHASATAAIR
jgi:hypothetical protein